MTTNEILKQRAQGCMAAPEFVTSAIVTSGVANPATGAAEETGAARRAVDTTAGAREPVLPGASRQRRMVHGAWTGGERASGDARLQSLAHAVDLPEDRLEKVLRLRQAIDSGQYRISAAEVADKLLGVFSSGPVPSEQG